MRYFGYLDGLTMTNRRFAELVRRPAARGRSRRSPEREMDLAASIQEVTEEIVLRIARHAREITGERHLCLAGGVALNCVANGRLLRGRASSTTSGSSRRRATRAARSARRCAVWHSALGGARDSGWRRATGMQRRLPRARVPAGEIRAFLDARGYPYRELIEDDAEWARRGRAS